jgi:hypothetical protein
MPNNVNSQFVMGFSLFPTLFVNNFTWEDIGNDANEG